MTRVLMLAFPELQPLDFMGPYDVFVSAGVEMVVVAQSMETVRADGRLSIRPDAAFAEAPEADALFVPGGSGVDACLTDDDTMRFLKRCRVDWYTSVCTGSLLLAAAGLLRGYRATSHWRYVDLLELGGAIPTRDQRIVIDRNRITAGGVTAGIDFGLQLVAHLCGEERARLTQLGLEYAPAPPFAGTPREALPETTLAYEAATFEHHARRRAAMAKATRAYL